MMDNDNNHSKISKGNTQYHIVSSSLRGLQAEWKQLEKECPFDLGRKPTDAELAVFLEHKERVQRFLDGLSADEALWFPSKMKPRKVRTKQVKKKRVRPCNNQPRLVRKAKAGEGVSLGWHRNDNDGDATSKTTLPTFVFTHVIPFNSHRTRRVYEREEDDDIYGGINRCVFSNLFVDDKPLFIPNDNDKTLLLGHGSRYEYAASAESFYMAAKSKYECDARFIMEDLKDNSMSVANFGHNYLQLTTIQKNRLIKLGADPTDFKAAGGSDAWYRGRDGILPTREGWKNMRHNAFLFILRHKFGLRGNQDQQGTETKRTVQALVSLISTKSEYPLMVEARRADGFWGEGVDGAGFNCLGRTITQILLEVADVVSDEAPYLTLEEAQETLLRSNISLIDYYYAEESR